MRYSVVSGLDIPANSAAPPVHSLATRSRSAGYTLLDMGAM